MISLHVKRALQVCTTYEAQCCNAYYKPNCDRTVVYCLTGTKETATDNRIRIGPFLALRQEDFWFRLSHSALELLYIRTRPSKETHDRCGNVRRLFFPRRLRPNELIAPVATRRDATRPSIRQCGEMEQQLLRWRRLARSIQFTAPSTAGNAFRSLAKKRRGKQFAKT